VRVVGSVEIDGPASEVFAYVADYGNDPSWRAAETQMRGVRTGPGWRPRKCVCRYRWRRSYGLGQISG
jgi:uncharacterized protein (DUF2237 family)